MTDITDNPDLASDLSAIAMNISWSNDPDIHGKLQEAFAAALAPLEAENQRLRAVLEKIATTGRCEFAVVRAALRSTREGG